MYPSNRVPYLWASYGGDSIASEFAVAPLFLNSIFTATHQEYQIEKIFLLSQRQSCEGIHSKNFYMDKVLSHNVFSDITLQQCRKLSMERITHSASQFPTVLHTDPQKLCSLMEFFCRNVTKSVVTLYRM